MDESQDLKNQLRALIKSETDNLICEAHPEVCGIRDTMYENLENMIFDLCVKKDMGVQEAIAHLEVELGHI